MEERFSSTMLLGYSFLLFPRLLRQMNLTVLHVRSGRLNASWLVDEGL